MNTWQQSKVRTTWIHINYTLRELDENSKVSWHVLILLFLLARTIRQCLVLQTKCIFYVSDPLTALLCRLLLLWILNYLGLARFVVVYK